MKTLRLADIPRYWRPAEPWRLGGIKPPWLSRAITRLSSVALLLLLPACNAIRNGWLDPTVIGNFEVTATNDIRTSLSLEDPPVGIPGSEFPGPQDLDLRIIEYPISAGDVITIEINELQDRLVPFARQVTVSNTGFVNLPVVGRVSALGLTVPEFEERLRGELLAKGILLEPEVTVRADFLQKSTYSIFGVGVSAANNAPLRAGTFPITRPNLKLLEAINQVGGLNEFVTEVYVFRDDNPDVDYPLPAEFIPPDEPPPPADVLPPGGPESPPAPESELGERPAAAELQQPSPSPADQPISHARPPRPASDEIADLIDLVENPADQGFPPDDLQREPSPDPDILEAIDDDIVDPFIYVDGEWVPNPEYTGPLPGRAPMLEERGTFDLNTPAAKWARLAGESTYRILRVPAEALRSGDPAANIYVRAGDVIRIVSGEIGVYYVMGQVNRAGGFAFNAEEVTLKAAIAAAGGLSVLAWPDRCTIYRRLGSREQMIQVNLDRIFAGKEPDFVIKRGDIINVGTHPFAPFLARIRALTLPNIVNNVGYSFTYARNFADIDAFEAQINPANRPDTFQNLLIP